MPSSGATLVPVVLLVVLAFPLALAAMFALVSKLLSALGGWGRIAASYPAPGQVDGHRLSMQPGMVGLVSYRNVLSLTVTPAGLGIAVFPLFRVGHAPLFIPWTAMHNLRPRRLLWWDLVAFDVGEPTIGRLALPAKVFERRPPPLPKGAG